MPFDFLKYLQPTHWFLLNRNLSASVFPIVENLPKEIVGQLQLDAQFQTERAQNYDLSWQAIQKGYIGAGETYQDFEILPLVDNYRFIRKYFHSAWVLYVLLVRLLTLKNPLKELKAFYVTKNTKRSDDVQTPIVYATWTDFKSELIARQPKVSVIIPTLNRYVYLNDVLKDLELQDYPNFEVIVVDQSEPFQEKFYKDFKLDLKVFYQEEKALWLARNTAVRAANGSVIALSEDDVRIKKDWISSHLKCLDFFTADVSAGVFYPEDHNIPKERSFFTLASQFATGNAVLYKSVFKKVGLFDRQFEKQRLGDGEFGLRVYLAGIRSVSNPFASCIDVKASTGGLREMGSWDAFRTEKWLAPRPIPSVLYFYRTYFGNKASKRALWRTVPLSIMPYQFKSNKVLLIVGAFISILLWPLVLFQVFRSWRLATLKLEEGPMIEELENNNDKTNDLIDVS